MGAVDRRSYGERSKIYFWVDRRSYDERSKIYFLVDRGMSVLDKRFMIHFDLMCFDYECFQAPEFFFSAQRFQCEDPCARSSR